MTSDDTVLVDSDQTLDPNTTSLDSGPLGNVFAYKQEESGRILLYEIYQVSRSYDG